MNTTTTTADTTNVTPTTWPIRPPSAHNKDGTFNWLNWGRGQMVGATLAGAALKHPGTRKSVFVELCCRADADGQCWPSQADIALYTCMSERQVRRELDGLEDDGWITRHKRTTAGGTFKSDLITINRDRGVIH